MIWKIIEWVEKIFPKIDIVMKTNRTSVFLLGASIILILIGMLTSHQYSDIVALLGLFGFAVSIAVIYLANAPKIEEPVMPPAHTDPALTKIFGVFKLVIWLGFMIVVGYVLSAEFNKYLPEQLQWLIWILFALFLISIAWVIIKERKNIV
ncbi:MAG: hypothetical protein NUV57_04680 [archaeon]|nr:hypothetical protein [archaeon]